MATMTVEMTEAELYALDLIAVDAQTWCDNVLTERARVAKEELKTTPEWLQALTAHIRAGGEPEQDWEILMRGKNMGLFKTAAVRQAESEAAMAERMAAETPSEE